MVPIGVKSDSHGRGVSSALSSSGKKAYSSIDFIEIVMKALLRLLGACTLVCSTGCDSSSVSSAELRAELPKLSVTHPLKQDANLTRDYVAQIRAIKHIELRALARGYLENVHVDEGQPIKAGQPMFDIMPRLYQAELGKAQAEAQFAEIEYANTEKLTKNKVVAPSELALAKAKLDKARAAAALEQVHLDFTRVKAPFDGIMGKFAVRPGSLVDDGELLTTLSDNHEMWVYFNVPEAEYIQYKRKGLSEKHMQVRLEMADGSIYEHPGVVTAIEADFNNETGNIAYRATFPNPEGLLRHGQTGKILVDTNIKEAMLVPQAAVFEILDKKFVLTVDESGKVHSKEIKVGAQMPDLFVVSDGLTNNDQILLEGQRKVIDGDVIEPQFQDPTQVVANLKVYAE